MPTLLISCRVANAPAWQQALNDDRESRRAYGAGREYLYQGVADPTEVLVAIEWDGEDRARLYACSDDVRELLAQSGSTEPHRVWILADDGSTMAVQR